MARSAPGIVAVNAGEFSPRMASRTDFSRYPAGAETLFNCLIDERGGIYRRPGTYYAGSAKSGSARSYLVDIVPNDDEAYVLEAFVSGFRFFKDQGQITVVSVSTAITNGTFAADVSSWTDKDTGAGASAWSATNGTDNGGSMSLNSGGTGATDIAWRQQTVTVAAGDTAKVHVLKFRVLDRVNDFVYCRIGTTDGGTELINDRKCGNGWHLVSFTPGTTTIYVQFLTKFQGNEPAFVDDVSFHSSGALEMTTPYIQADLPDIRWAGTNDVIYFVHGDYQPYRLLRYGDRDWSFETVFFRDGPYLDTNTDSTFTITPGATTGLSITMTANKPLFDADDVNRLLRIQYTNLWGYVLLHTYTSTTVMSGTILRTLGGTTASANWALGAWSTNTGFPKQVELFKQRSVFAHTDEQPTTVWMSQAGDLENMMPDSEVGATPVSTIEDDDAVIYTVVERRGNVIVGLNAGRDLVAHTAGAEIPLTSDGPVITPTDVNASAQTTYGSNGVDPNAINSVTVFVQKGGRRILRLGFDIRLEGYAAEDLTILSEHITRSGVIKMAHQQEPNSIIWCLLANGTLAALTFHPEQQVAGWTRHEIGGKFDGRNAVVEDIVTIPGGTSMGSNERDEVWMIVKRTINGATARYIEFLEADYDLEDPVETAVYADCALMLDYWNTDTTKTLTLQGDTLATSGDPESDEAAYDAAWESGDSVTLEATGHTPFASGDVDQVWLLCYKGEILGVTITAYTDSNTVTVTLNQDAPRSFRNASVTRWLDPTVKTTTISGASHLEAETVKVLGDGAVLDDETIASGAATASESSGTLIVGLPYESQYKSLKIDAGSQLGTAIGRPRRTGDITLAILAATGFRIGPTMDIADMQEVETRERNDPIGLRAKLWKGEFPIPTGGPWSKDPRICLKSSDPRPWFILSLAPEFNTNEAL